MSRVQDKLCGRAEKNKILTAKGFMMIWINYVKKIKGIKDAQNLSHNFNQSFFPPVFHADGTVTATSRDIANLSDNELFSSSSTINYSELPVPPVSPI